ncbi:transcription factor MUTE-like [Macadamia integrifolia]|uniref:transcription factor MUTE-like n=1 Tax=Macadamia integrifolia TaxID=60698 RepID=UPI001C5317B0|nr:transcription factor MUTE-like [Macadamia integrifolia]
MSHIAVERNRRRQMNEHLKVLRDLTPCFYIKRGDQASIVGGVIEFIKELDQVLQSLESKKRRKSLSPSPSPSPRQLPTPSPRQVFQRPPPSLPLLLPPPPPPTPTPTPESTFGLENIEDLGAACFNSQVAEVEAKISGSNVILRTISKRIPGQIVKIISLLEKLAFEILHISISSMEDTVLCSFVIKIGLECQLSLEDLAAEVQQSFCQDVSFVN